MSKTKLIIGVFACIMILGLGSLMVVADEVEPGDYYNFNDYQQLTGNRIKEFKDSPLLTEKVKSGQLPSVEDRLPENPLVLVPVNEIGKYGGTLDYDSIMPNSDGILRHINDIDLLSLPLTSKVDRNAGPWVGKIQPGVFSKWDMSDDGKVFTFTIRNGLKWSDGKLVTTEDVRYFIKDVLMNKEATPTPPDWISWGAESNKISTELEIVDDYTFKLIFAKPNPTFIYDYRSTNETWASLIRPAHHLKQFHKDYTSWDKLLPVMKEDGFNKEDWGTFYEDKVGTAPTGGGTVTLKEDAIGYPTLSPYVPVNVKENGDVIFERNPYFSLIDSEGNQLPYIEKVYRHQVADKEMMNMDIIAGKVDFDPQLSIQDYPLFFRNQEEGNYKVEAIPISRIMYVIFYCNLSYEEKPVRKIFQNLKFRQALSLALNRNEMKEALFMGTGKATQFAPKPGTEYYEEGMEEAYADYNPEKAKQLLDEIGLIDKDGDGWRERPDGEPFIIDMEVIPVGTTLTITGAEMAGRHWENIGIKVNVKQVTGDYWWQLHGGNEIMIGNWWAHGMNPNDPWHLGFRMNSPQWREWYMTDGEKGIEPLPWAKEMLEAQENFKLALSKEEAVKYGKKMWQLQAKYIPIIGTVAWPSAPVVYSADLGNIPQDLQGIVSFQQSARQWYFKE